MYLRACVFWFSFTRRFKTFVFDDLSCSPPSAQAPLDFRARPPDVDMESAQPPLSTLCESSDRRVNISDNDDSGNNDSDHRDGCGSSDNVITETTSFPPYLQTVRL